MMQNSSLSRSRAVGLIAFFIYLIAFIKPAYSAVATTVPTAADMIKNIADQLPALMLFTTGLAYLLGFYFIFRGLLLLKKFAEQRTQMSGEAKMSGPLISIFVGAALIYLPSAIQSGMTTFWLNPTPYAYQTSSGDEWSTFLSACFMIIQLVGVIAFIRGLIALTHIGQGGQQGGIGRALAYIISGIFCIDIVDFINAVFVTLGLQPLQFT